ncbi:hypothetical protein CY34DRAFT_111297, partial [Suillus luteus UH-Slu-Lm8-n1]
SWDKVDEEYESKKLVERETLIDKWKKGGGGPEGCSGGLNINTPHDATVEFALAHWTKRWEISEGRDGGKVRREVAKGNIPREMGSTRFDDVFRAPALLKCGNDALIIAPNKYIRILDALTVNEYDGEFNGYGLKPPDVARGAPPCCYGLPESPTPVPKQSNASTGRGIHPDVIVPRGWTP